MINFQQQIQLKPSQLQTMYVHYKPGTRKYMIKMVRNEIGPVASFKKAIVVKSKSKRNKAMVITAKSRGINMHQYRSLPIK